MTVILSVPTALLRGLSGLVFGIDPVEEKLMRVRNHARYMAIMG